MTLLTKFYKQVAENSATLLHKKAEVSKIECAAINPADRTSAEKQLAIYRASTPSYDRLLDEITDLEVIVKTDSIIREGLQLASRYANTNEELEVFLKGVTNE